jgi:hypothetical protein
MCSQWRRHNNSQSSSPVVVRSQPLDLFVEALTLDGHVGLIKGIFQHVVGVEDVYLAQYSVEVARVWIGCDAHMRTNGARVAESKELSVELLLRKR